MKFTRDGTGQFSWMEKVISGPTEGGLMRDSFQLFLVPFVNIPKLSHVISDYYGAYNETKGPANSPMIIKLVT